MRLRIAECVVQECSSGRGCSLPFLNPLHLLHFILGYIICLGTPNQRLALFLRSYDPELCESSPVHSLDEHDAWEVWAASFCACCPHYSLWCPKHGLRAGLLVNCV